MKADGFKIYLNICLVYYIKVSMEKVLTIFWEQQKKKGLLKINRDFKPF